MKIQSSNRINKYKNDGYTEIYQPFYKTVKYTLSSRIDH